MTAPPEPRKAPQGTNGARKHTSILDRVRAQTDGPDVSELLRRVDELESCINTLAHDLRSPLVALLGFSRLLRQDYGEKLDETGLHFVDRIEQAGRTMEALIHDWNCRGSGNPGSTRPWSARARCFPRYPLS